LAFDSQGNYITDGSHPAYKALGDAYRERAASSPISVRWGGDFQSFNDPGHFEIDGGARTAAPQLDLSDLAEPAQSFDLADIADAPADTYGPAVETNARQVVEPQST